MGGEATGSLVLGKFLLALCERECGGGGPGGGGGGGSGMVWSHLIWEAERDLAEVGVSMAPVEAARRAEGGALGDAGSSIGLWGGSCGMLMLGRTGRDTLGPKLGR